MSHDRVPGPEEIPARTPPQPVEVPVAGRKFVVGIGASAGGLDPLVRFFESLPRVTGMAFVIVQHLSPDFKSLMDELLGRHTMLPIHLVEDGMPVEADHVYLIPAKKEMIISGGRLLLSERDRQQELTLPIDMFFRSLAQDCGADAIAIVLSGGGSDGSRGIRHIREAGGLVVAQDLDSAQFDGMPRAAIDTGVVHHTCRRRRCHWCCSTMPVAERAAIPDAADSERPEPRGLEALYRVLETEFGIDFNHYKPSTVTRRIERRLALAQSQNIDEYLARLRSERDELDALYRDLLIGVTRFFRDPDAFDLLEHQILPELLRRSRAVPPCGCGSLDAPPAKKPTPWRSFCRMSWRVHGERPVKIFATDVHRGSVERAALAAYDEEAVSNVSAERLTRYFTQNGHTYQVVPELRQMIVFAQHNVIKDAPFTRLDLITCRNLLIYLQPPAQQRVLSFFHFAPESGWRAAARPVREPWTARRRVRSGRQALAALSKSRRGTNPRRPAAAASDVHRCRARRRAPAATRHQAYAGAAALGLRRAARRNDAAESDRQRSG